MAETQTLTCKRCNFQWERAVVIGPVPKVCPDCRTQDGLLKPTKRRSAVPADRFDKGSPGYVLAKRQTEYRLAMEMASSALFLGRNDEAYEILQAALHVAKSHKVTTTAQAVA